MTLKSGSRIGTYEVLEAIGAGGMGEVFRAHDTRLGRDVALKVLPEAFALDPERLARFKREAQLLASLNHPNIAAIYGFEDAPAEPGQPSRQALVLELVEGPTLAEQIAAAGPGRGLGVDESLRVARQIAEALEAAHEQGIIHRDLKPANVKVRPDGAVKVLDFGLAKALAPEPASSPSADLSRSPTLTTPMATHMGVILGTAAYMAPEQARGRPADRRADVWAFGCVLYEMLTGKRAFEGEDVTDTLAAIVRGEPDWSALPADTPPIVRKLLRRCLEKDRRERVPDIAVARLEIKEALTAPPPAAVPVAVPAPPASSRRLAAVAAVALAGGAILAAATVYLTMRRGPEPMVRLAIVHRGDIEAWRFPFDPDVTISADARHVVYAAGNPADGADLQLFVRALDALEAVPLAGLSEPRAPFLSPDGRWVGFFSGVSELQKVAIDGGPPVTICAIDGAPRGGSWGPDDTIVFATQSLTTGLQRVPAGGGAPEILTHPDEGKSEDHLYPDVLPNGRGVLFTIVQEGRGDTGRIAVLDSKSGETKVLLPSGSYPRYVASGHLVYGVLGTMRAVPFDLDRLEVRGDPVPVVDKVITKGTGAASFAVSAGGTLVYIAGTVASSSERTLVWVDRKGQEEPIKAPPRAYVYARLSPDGTRIAVDIRDQDNDIWIWDIARETLTRLTFEAGFNRGPVWTPDGRRLASSTLLDGAEAIHWRAADGTGKAERLSKGATVQMPTSFTPDGRQLIFSQPGVTPFDIGVVDLAGDRAETLLLSEPKFSETNGALSPDGRWLAYQSNESGREEIYVRPFPTINDGRWQVSNGGGSRPVWARNGRELFYYRPPGTVMAVTIPAGATFAAGNPQQLFAGRYAAVNAGFTYDVSPDGKRFLMIKPVDVAQDAEQPRLVVVQNWFQELERLAPVK